MDKQNELPEYKILLVAGIVKEGEDKPSYGYVRELHLPFVPAIGMQFAQGISSKMWETTDGLELNPAVEEVIYDLDEEQFVCLFTVNRELAASFWTAVENPTMEGHVCASLNFFRHRS